MWTDTYHGSPPGSVHGRTRQQKMPLPLLPFAQICDFQIMCAQLRGHFSLVQSPAVRLTYIYWFWSPLSPVLFNVCTKGLADPTKLPTLVDDGLIYKTSKNSQKASEAVQQQLDSVSQWCHDTRSLISPGKAQTLVHAWQQSSRQTSASSHIWWSSGWPNKPSNIPLDPLW